ncbi:MAG: hypothetical protein WCJ35_20215 [Planctomycetota bacterium]
MNMPDDDIFFAAVNVKLTAIAEASRTPPSWYGDWMRLEPGSTKEERLAVYQAIRDSGCLPEEAGFCLMSWWSEVMADLEAETSLQNLNKRMEAMEKEYESERGELWPNDQVPEEYEELSRQYQDAWDEIFVKKLKAFGEQEIADMYSAAPKQFDRCYEIGLQYLLGPIKAAKAISPDELVRVVSCPNVPLADLAQQALAREGIPASLGNANFLSWFWDYGNAVGGATVHVRNKDAKQAREVLAAARAKPSVSLPPWICLSCGQRIAGQWNACWQCGQLADGTLASPQSKGSAAQPQDDADAEIWLNVPRLFTAVAVVGLVILLCMYGWGPPLMLAPCVVILVFVLWQFEPSSNRESQPQGSAEPSDPCSHIHSNTQSEVSKAIVRRAWQAAVIAAFSFPPIGFYSMRLLWKLGQRDTPLGRGDNWRCWTAFFLNIATILFCLAFAVLLLLGFLGALV